MASALCHVHLPCRHGSPSPTRRSRATEGNSYWATLACLVYTYLGVMLKGEGKGDGYARFHLRTEGVIPAPHLCLTGPSYISPPLFFASYCAFIGYSRTIRGPVPGLSRVFSSPQGLVQPPSPLPLPEPTNRMGPHLTLLPFSPTRGHRRSAQACECIDSHCRCRWAWLSRRCVSGWGWNR